MRLLRFGGGERLRNDSSRQYCDTYGSEGGGFKKLPPIGRVGATAMGKVFLGSQMVLSLGAAFSKFPVKREADARQ